MAERLHLNIPEPCHENWQQMTPNEQGRHCLSCQKTVVDFTLMSDQEVLRYISTASTSVCGRFHDDQLNKTYTEQRIKPSFTWRYIWQVVVSGFLLLGHSVSAQTRNVKGKVATVKQEKPDTNLATKGEIVDAVSRDTISYRLTGTVGMVAVYRPHKRVVSKIAGVVLDENTGRQISDATIQIKGTNTGVLTDEYGVFIVDVKSGERKVVMVVSAIGYTTKEVTVSLKRVESLKVVLEQSTTILTGEVVCVRKPSKREQVKQVISDWASVFTREVKVYPNPVVPGSNVNISVSFKKTGDYKLELMDAGGRIVHVQGLQVVDKEQVVAMPTQSTWTSGVYWLRIAGANNKKVYQTKVVLQ
ncbi:carboxypeptidase-like regulatory domain-containing protein [Paraflavitalea sp. CAU 1676]|uniref:carboxypeptidase-like regulatory domain-containing protein n=1 Tax=Paraflavitalea sp. CAU 1676 TaxID=3032598 RepID=UPI0023DB071B|nr:carboxypeptidase-like regulatory domain-containing protein [Paraflavitalea sp. CAU 1676]MDF2191813.1 carboxypeptidase-like regulatory domain-containing protein [Paraflavitalea sp. CAU 1676]